MPAEGWQPVVAPKMEFLSGRAQPRIRQGADRAADGRSGRRLPKTGLFHEVLSTNYGR